MKKIISLLFLFVLNIYFIPFRGFAIENTNMLHVAMATNDNYIYQTLVSVTSAAENKNSDTEITFHILLSDDVSEENKKILMGIQNKYDSCKINLIDMGQSFSTAKTARKNFTSAYYRLRLASLLPDLEKVLYVDGDTIILKDLSELYNMNINDFYVAGVREYWSAINNPGYEKVIDIPSMNQYINSGVLLMNLDKIRKDNMEKEFEKYVEEKHRPENRIGRYHDQDVLNYTCYDKILHIPLKYNAMHSCIYDYYCTVTRKLDISLFNNIKDYYGEEEWNEAVNNPDIIHYVGSSRPWGTPIKLPGSLTWWKYAKKTDILDKIVQKFRNKWNTHYMDQMLEINF